MQPLKIGVIAHFKHAVREPFAGGLEMHTHCLCRRLRERGHTVTLFAAEGSDDSGLEAQCLPTFLTGDNFPYSFRAEHLSYRRLMQHLAHRAFDVIHNNSLHYLAVAMAASLPMPVVTLLHTPPFWEIEGALRLSRGANNLCVAVSQTMRRGWLPITDVPDVVFNGIDLDHFRFRQFPDDRAYLIWSGRIVPEKGLHLAMAAAAELGMELRFAGPIADRRYYHAEIEPKIGAGNRYLGHLSHDELVDVIGGARVCLFTPLWEEPYGLALVEALACGTPVAAFARGAVIELLDASCGVVAGSDTAAALAAAVRQALELSRAACRNRGELIGNAETMVSHYESLYQRVIEQKRRSPPAAPGEVDVAGIAPENEALIACYARHVPTMSCALPRARP